jgi:hypothetical protein
VAVAWHVAFLAPNDGSIKSEGFAADDAWIFDIELALVHIAIFLGEFVVVLCME